MMVLSAAVSSPTTSKFDVLVQLAREVAHQARKAFEHLGNRQHPHIHDGALHFLGEAVDDGILVLDFAPHVPRAVNVLGASGQERQAVLRHHQFGDQVHQRVDLGLSPP